jgi:hypothetical protein
MGPSIIADTEGPGLETEQRSPRTCRAELRCIAIGRNGSCRAPRRPGSQFCYWHDEQLRDYRRLACSRGGRTPRRNAFRSLLADFDWEKYCLDHAWDKYIALIRRGLALGQLSVSAYDRLIEDGRRIYSSYSFQAEENEGRCEAGEASDDASEESGETPDRA